MPDSTSLEPPGPVTEDRLLTSAEVAAMWQVNTRTPSRWASKGQLPSIRTLGGHYRFSEAQVLSRLGAPGDPQ